MTRTNVNEKIIELGDDGIHKRVHRVPLNEDGTRKSWQGVPENQFWEHIEWLMLDCERILIENGFPSPNDRAYYAAGYGWLLTEVEPKNETEEKIKSLCKKKDIEAAKAIWAEWGKPSHGAAFGDQLAIKLGDVFQEAWYAGQIFSLCRQIIDNRDSSYSGHLTRIYQIAEFEKDREWRRDFGLTIKRDIKWQKGRSLGGETRRAQTKSKKVRVLSEMKRLIEKGQSISRAAQLTFDKDIGTSADANRKCWTRNHPKS